MNELEIKVKLAIADLQKGVGQARAEIKSLDKEKASVIIDLKKEQLQADLQKIKEEFHKLRETGIRPITFTADKQKLEESIAQVQENLKNLSNQKVTPEIKIERDKLKADLSGLQTDLKKLEATKTKAEIELQKEKATEDLAKIKLDLAKLDKVKIDIEIDKSKIANAIAEIKTGISREIGAKLAQGLAEIPSAIAKTTLQFEKLQTVLKTTLGSQSEADKAFALIKDFAASTPFQVSQITDSFIKLQNRGITPTKALLTQLGDLASSQGKSLDQVTEAILDASTGEFERLKEFGIQASKAGDQVTIAFKGTQQTVSNTPTAINAAIASLGDLKGVSGGMEAQSKTLGGALSNLQDTADTLSVAFGQELTPILLEIVKGFSESGASAEDFAKGAGKNVGNAIKFLVDNADKLKIVLELVVLQFALTKGAAAAAGIEVAIAGVKATLAAGGFTALATSAGVAALSIGAVVAPLALAYAGFKAIETIRTTKDMKELAIALDTSSATAQTLGNETFKLASKLKALGEARKAGKGDSAKEDGYLAIAKKDLENREKLKKDQEEIAKLAANPNQKQDALIQAKDYGIQANALKDQIANLEKIKSAKDLSTEATKQDTKALKELAKEQAQLAKAKSEIDLSSKAKKENLIRDESQKGLEKGVESKRDKALGDLKLKQEEEAAKFRLDRENILGDRKRAIEKEIADFKDGKEKALEAQKRDFEKKLENDKDAYELRKQASELAFQKKKQNDEQAFQDRLSGAKNIIDRETKLGTATPEEADKLRQQFAEEDRIKKQVLSTNVNTNASKETFANQAKAIAGVPDIKSQEDAAKVQFALAELEAKAKAQFADEERKKDEAYKERQRIADNQFRQQQEAASLNFKLSVLAPQEKAIADAIEAKKVQLEQSVLQPLKLKQETEIAQFKQAQDNEANALKTKFEGDLAAIRKEFKLQEINLDSLAQKDKLDREFAFKQNQRDLDLQNAVKISQILSAASVNKLGLGAAVGIPKFANGIENFGGGLAYVHAGEVLMNLSKGTSVIPANQVNNSIGGNSTKYEVNINSSKDPNQLLSETLQQLAVNEMRRAGN